MFFTLKDLIERPITDREGALGSLQGFVIDDFAWVVRYIIARIDDHSLLLSVNTMDPIDPSADAFVVNVPRATLRNSPTLNIDQPISREIERQVSNYYGWSYYWQPEDIATTMPGDLTEIPLIEMEIDHAAQIQAEENLPDSDNTIAEDSAHLVSTHQIFGATIHSLNDDTDSGKLSDMIIQPEDWKIMYLVIDTGGLLPGKKVIFAPTWAKRIDPADGRIDVDLTEESIHASPSLDTLDLA